MRLPCGQWKHVHWPVDDNGTGEVDYLSNCNLSKKRVTQNVFALRALRYDR